MQPQLPDQYINDKNHQISSNSSFNSFSSCIAYIKAVAKKLDKKIYLAYIEMNYANNYPFTIGILHKDASVPSYQKFPLITLVPTYENEVSWNKTYLYIPRHVGIGHGIYHSSGFYVDTLQTINGCDSIVTMDMTINYSIQTIDSLVACDSAMLDYI
ncbi:hypothetical protein N9K77_02015 [bacterium]|nr:hypothetical protein [bacterium]